MRHAIPKTVARLTLALIAIFAVTGVSRAALPGAENPKAYTERQYQADRVEFYRKMLVDDYGRLGKQDPRWDGRVRQLLEGLSKRQGYALARRDVLLEAGEMPTWSELDKLARAAVDAGCDDPLVLDCFAIVLDNEGLAQQASGMLKRATEPLAASQYSRFLAADSVRRSLELAEREKSKRFVSRYTTMFHDLLVDAVATPGLTMPQRRAIFEYINRHLSNHPVDRFASVCNDIEKNPNSDPWLSKVLRARQLTCLGWAYRGQGYANTVSDEGWKKLRECLEPAKVALEEAERIDSSNVETAHVMIGVLRGLDAEASEQRAWFERGVAMQIDDPRLATDYLENLEPRWGGDYRQMYSVAYEFTTSNRYDTRLPFMFVEAMDLIRHDAGNDWSFWRADGMIESAAALFEQYASRSKDPAVARFYLSGCIGYGWQIGRYDIARAALDKLGGKYDAAMVGRADVVPSRTVSGTYALTGEFKNDLLDAEKKAGGGDTASAVEVYKQTLAKLKPDDPSLPWVRGRAKELAWQEQFAKGEEVDLTPDKDLSGWYPINGQFTSDGTALIGTTAGNNSGASIVCGAKFGRNWRLTGNSEILDFEKASAELQGSVGPLECWRSPDDFLAFYVRPATNDVAWHSAYMGTHYFACDAKLGASSPFEVCIWGTHIVTRAAGARAWAWSDLGEYATRPDNRIGIGSDTKMAGVQFKVTELKIKALDQEPPH